VFKFGARQTRQGATYAIRRGQRKKIAGSFLETRLGTPVVMPSGHRGVFVRKGDPRVMKRGRFAGQVRQPIVELMGPSVPAVVEGIREFARGTFEAALMDRLSREIDRQIAVILERGR